MSNFGACFVGGAGGMALVIGAINHPSTPLMPLEPSVLVGVGVGLFIAAFGWNAAHVAKDSAVEQ